MKNNEIIKAIDFALEGEWDSSHKIVADLNSTQACWLHAVLHRIEGDQANARYWYSMANKKISDIDPMTELQQIKAQLNSE